MAYKLKIPKAKEQKSYEVGKNRKTEFIVKEIILNGGGDTSEDFYSTEISKKDAQKILEEDLTEGGVVYEIDNKNKKYRMIMHRWGGEIEKDKDKWLEGKP